MAQLSKISKVTLPSGSTYVIKDEAVWNALTEILGEPVWNETNQVYEFPAGNITNLEEVTNVFNQYTTEQNEYITNINEAATYDVTEDITLVESSELDEVLPTAGAVKDYVDAQVGAIHNFDVVIDSQGTASGPSLTADESNMYKLVLVPDQQHASAGEYIEWILIRNSSVTPNTYTWEQIGSTKLNLSGYVDEETLEGVKIGDTELGADLKWTASEVATELGLGDLAYQDDASGTVEAQTFDNVTATGSITATISEATLSHTDTAAVISSSTTYTPAGNVSVSLTTATANLAAEADYTPTGAVNVAQNSDVTVLKSAVFAADNDGVQITGTVSAPTVTVTLNTATVSHVTNAGTAYTLSGGSVVKGTDSTRSFAKKVLDATMSSNETLVFSFKDETEFGAGSEATHDVFEDAVTSAGTITYTTPTLSGALPTFEDVVAATGVDSASADAPTFTGGKYKVTTTTEDVLSDDAQFTFSGNQATISVTGQYEKATGASGSFTATNNVNVPTAITYEKAEMGNVSISISDPVLNVSTFTVTAKTVTVS